MKIYIRSAVSVDKLKQQFDLGLAEDEFAEIYNLDPTADYDSNKPSKYGVWLFNQYKKGNLKPTSYARVHQGLATFSKSPSKFTYNDLGRYKTVDEFLDDAKNVELQPTTEDEKAKKLKKAAHGAGDNDKKFLAKEGSWELWQPLTYAGSISLARQGGAKAGWCTAFEGNDKKWAEYTANGSLYIFINTSDPSEKYQVQFESKEFCDFNNEKMSMVDFADFISDMPKFQKALNLTMLDGCIIYKDVLIAYAGDATSLDLSDANISKIDFMVFSDCTSLVEVRLPEGLKEIGNYAFYRCARLAEINIPDSVQKIGKLAFRGCESLDDESLADIEDFCDSTDIDVGRVI